MRIGMVGAVGDAHVQALAEALSSRQVDSFVVESRGMLDRVAHTLDGSSLRVDGEDLSDVAAWYVRFVAASYYRPPSPAAPATTDPALRAQVALQSGWLQNLAHAGVPVVNSAGAGGRSKPLQLAIAREVGLAIPHTIVTNSVTDIDAFGALHGRLVQKPVDGGDICRPLEAADVSRLDPVLDAPIIVQQRVEGRAVRVTMSRRDVFSAVAISSQFLDYRDDPVYQAGEAVYHPVSVPAETTSLLSQFMERYQLDFAGIDLIQTAHGEHVFLEANSSPMWLEIEQRSGHPITSQLADLLVELAARSVSHSRGR
ncbi:MAG: hypothetical protein ABMA25_27215 [Ilumatobacteraceae bacterium]